MGKIPNQVRGRDDSCDGSEPRGRHDGCRNGREGHRAAHYDQEHQKPMYPIIVSAPALVVTDRLVERKPQIVRLCVYPPFGGGGRRRSITDVVFDAFRLRRALRAIFLSARFFPPDFDLFICHLCQREGGGGRRSGTRTSGGFGVPGGGPGRGFAGGRGPGGLPPPGDADVESEAMARKSPSCLAPCECRSAAKWPSRRRSPARR